ncbi:MAG TPA: hypothetical protein VHS54_12625 [Jatrophihabitans sp.]|nr:hypothetical protein [Jatrophihabitans sp.]
MLDERRANPPEFEEYVMNRLTIAVAIAAAAITVPTAAALASEDPSTSRGPAHSTVIDDRRGPNRGSDDVTRAPSAASTASAGQPRNANGRHVEPGDDRGTAVVLSGDRGRQVEPGDDRGGDDGGHHHGHDG